LVFDLGEGEVILVPGGELYDFLPGEVAPALPAFIAYAARVRDLHATRALLATSRMPVSDSPTDGILVSAKAALGAALIFR
jgi:hypothetical protein